MIVITFDISIMNI